MWKVSNAFKTAVTKSHRAVSRVDVCTPGGQVLATLPDVVTGKVDVDETRAIRRTCQINCVSEGRSLDDFVPVNSGDLLHPASGNELRVYRGIRFDDGTEEMCPLGVFRLTTPKVEDKNGEINITLNGQDRSAWIDRIVWQQIYQIAAGTSLDAALQAAIASRVPGLNYNFTPIPDVTGIVTWGKNIAANNNPWKDFTKLATSFGYELFFDVVGNPTLRPSIDPTSQPVVAQFIEGAGCVMITTANELDETKEHNGCIVIGKGKGGKKVKPVQALVYDNDPTSPTYWFGSWGQSPYVFETHEFPYPGQSSGSAAAQATKVANYQFQLVRRAFENVTVTTLPYPALDISDCVNIVRAASGVRGQFTISKFTIPLEVSTAMSMTMRPRASA